MRSKIFNFVFVVVFFLGAQLSVYAQNPVPDSESLRGGAVLPIQDMGASPVSNDEGSDDPPTAPRNGASQEEVKNNTEKQEDIFELFSFEFPVWLERFFQ